jgi:hypothetical protein
MTKDELIEHCERCILFFQKQKPPLKIDDVPHMSLSYISQSDILDYLLKNDYAEAIDFNNNLVLTKKGRRFKSFKNERRKEWVKNHVKVSDLIIAFIAAGLSLLTGYILWRIDSRVKRQELKEIQEQVQKVNDRLDSLANPLIYQKKIVDTATHK